MYIKDRYIGVEYYGAFQFYKIPPPLKIIVIVPFFTTLLELRTREGGLKKRWFYNQSEDNPIQSIKVELTEKGFGICKVIFSDLMFPIEASDTIRIFFGGRPFYEGIVDNDIDPSFPELTASPFWKRFEECVVTNEFPTGVSVRIILETIISSVEEFTGVKWNGAKVDLGDTPPVVAFSFQSDKAKELIDQMVEIAGISYYWGVDADREFFVSRYEEEPEIDFKFFAYENAPFEKMEVKVDYSNIEMTEAEVYCKVKMFEDDEGEVLRIGTVGDKANIQYPELDIVKKIRPKQGKITAHEGWLIPGSPDYSQALNWAYEHLKRIVDKVTTVKINKIDLERYFPSIGKTVLVEDGFKRTMAEAINCETTEGWENVSLATEQGRYQGKAIKLFLNGTNNSYYDYGREVLYYNQEKIGFYIKAPIDSIIKVSFSKTLTPTEDETFLFGMPDDNVLSYKDFKVTWGFRYIIFDYIPGNIFIDDFLVFCETKKQTQTTIKKITINWDEKGVKCDAEGGYIVAPESDEFNKLSRKIYILEAINNI